MAQIVKGEFDRSKRLEVLTETDQERRTVIENQQATVVKQTEIVEERRSFLTLIVAGFGAILTAATLYPVVRFILPPAKQKKEETNLVVGKTSEVPPNSGKIVVFNGQKLLITNVGGEFKAISAICTHLQCIVQWKKDEQLVWCACHNAKYNTDGEKLSGPQPAGLGKFVIKIQDDNLVISRA
jgi:cytochrome b6-f complex iron-sulfur subunit